MRGLVVLSIILIFLSAGVRAQQAPCLYEVLADSAEKKILKGFITKAHITGDADFAWYAQNRKFVKPAAANVETVSKKMQGIQLFFFIGTWCHDSQQILPRYFALLEAAGFPEEQMVIVACDRQKTAPGNIQRPLHVVNVPTLLVMKDGKEVGRIVEYGNTGLADKELAEILSRL